ncbi:ABC transporter ATP-binding protein [Nocardia brasiliensis]|uniref:ABC transporter ATP-binding protein n=1 Tax=Nocardia brasiliensis TaxID=37326 RepID=UPI001895D4B2|nr:ATP-binding cassette domain-containing protein [Nocardia brasiliensis]MBF6546352.1 ABC transporter ATP-binding protein [Nocardia brasiliensis]
MAERGRDAAVRDSVLDGDLGADGDSRSAPAESTDRSGVPSCPVLVDGLAVHGPNGQELFGPLDFRIEAGSVAALTGPSGAGKTTLMRALLGDLPRGAWRSGSVVVAGHDVFALYPAALQRFRRTHVAYVGQDPGSALNPLMRVHGLLHEVAPHATRDYLVETLELVGLSPEHLRRRAAELSGGQQRRVALARALIRHTDALILDEPLAGLHGALRSDIARLLTEVAADRSVAVLLSGHDTATIHAVADQVIELDSAVTTLGSPGRPAAAALRFSRTTPRSAEASLIDPARRDAAAEPSSAERAATAFEAPAPDRAGPGHTPLLLRGNGITACIAGREVLTGIDVELAAGSALAVVGASGAGKTTLARVIAGLHRTATGTLELHGAPLPLAHGARKSLGSRGIQLVTQNPRSALNPRRTVAQTLGRPLRRIGRVPRRQVAQHVTELLAAVELAPELAQRYPHQLSGGQRQRVAVARALAAEPAVLLCDEITSALDHATAAALMALLDRIRTERAMGLLVISHDMSLVAAHCPRLVVLDHGRIVESGETATVLAAPAQQATRDLLR